VAISTFAWSTTISLEAVLRGSRAHKDEDEDEDRREGVAALRGVDENEK
jgi:hypothetical protein